MGGFFAISFTLDRSPYTPQKYSGQTQEQALLTNQVAQAESWRGETLFPLLWRSVLVPAVPVFNPVPHGLWYEMPFHVVNIF